MFEQRMIHIDPSGKLWSSEGVPPPDTQEISGIVEVVDGVAVDYWLRLSAAKAMLAARMRHQTGAYIATHLSDHDQINIQAASLSLLRFHGGEPPSDLAEEIKVAMRALARVEEWTRSVRKAGKAVRAAIEAAENPADLNEVNWSLPPAPVEQIEIAKAATLF